jgi:hypothetical protein
LRPLRAFLLGCLLAAGASAAEGDAIAIAENIRARHMPYGAILDPIFVQPDTEELLTYTRCGDSAIWTGISWLPNLSATK